MNESPNLPTFPFNTASPAVGEPVVALGAPLGLSNSVTSGIVSALDRTIEVPGDNGPTALLVSAIQTDAAINPGNSGGAMTNCSGQLIGGPSAGATVPSPSGQSSAGSVGLGFAIPASLAEPVANEIIQTGTVSHAYFGIQVFTIPKAAADRAGVSQGLYVAQWPVAQDDNHPRIPTLSQLDGTARGHVIGEYLVYDSSSSPSSSSRWTETPAPRDPDPPSPPSWMAWVTAAFPAER
jgi:S1-C subfamily serine protease